MHEGKLVSKTKYVIHDPAQNQAIPSYSPISSYSKKAGFLAINSKSLNSGKHLAENSHNLGLLGDLPEREPARESEESRSGESGDDESPDTKKFPLIDSPRKASKVATPSESEGFDSDESPPAKAFPDITSPRNVSKLVMESESEDPSSVKSPAAQNFPDTVPPKMVSKIAIADEPDESYFDESSATKNFPDIESPKKPLEIETVSDLEVIISQSPLPDQNVNLDSTAGFIIETSQSEKAPLPHSSSSPELVDAEEFYDTFTSAQDEGYIQEFRPTLAPLYESTPAQATRNPARKENRFIESRRDRYSGPRRDVAPVPAPAPAPVEVSPSRTLSQSKKNRSKKNRREALQDPFGVSIRKKVSVAKVTPHSMGEASRVQEEDNGLAEDVVEDVENAGHKVVGGVVGASRVSATTSRNKKSKEHINAASPQVEPIRMLSTALSTANLPPPRRYSVDPKGWRSASYTLQEDLTILKATMDPRFVQGPVKKVFFEKLSSLVSFKKKINKFFLCSHFSLV